MILHRDNELGSIAPGKFADFAILEQDSYKVNPDKIKGIKVWGTVFEGKKFRAK